MSDYQTLYRHYNCDDQLLYVGISSRLPTRTHEHSKHSQWWGDIKKIQIEHFPDRLAALNAEKAAILAENPLHNQHHNKRKSTRLDGKREITPEQIKPSDKIVERIVNFAPLYEIGHAAAICGISLRVIRREIDEGRLGMVSLPNNTGTKMKIYVSGWQIIDWLESMGAKP